MLNFPSARDDWRLDVVSILAVLGENNIKLNAPLITLSRTCYLPRLVPAPQGLLAERVKTLPYEEGVKVVGAFSGNIRDGLNYFGNVLHGSGADLSAFSCQEVTITQGSREDPSKSPLTPNHPEELKIRLNPLGPLPILACFSSLLSLALLIWAALIQDGVAVVGIVVMSLAAPALSLNIRWHLKIETRHNTALSPPGDLVIRHRNGVFTIVHCSEAIARQIYLAPEQVQYSLENSLGILSSAVVGGLVFTVAIILFGNCSWTMQAALAVSYIVLNAAYWLVAALAIQNPRIHWDFRSIHVEGPIRMHTTDYTHALCNAIRMSKSTAWVVPSQSMPTNETWNRWLSEAGRNLYDKDWNPKAAWDRIALDLKGENVA